MLQPNRERMSESADNSSAGVSGLAIFQIAASAVIQIVILFRVDAYWAICTTPIAFAMFAAIHMSHLDSERQGQFKRLLTVLAVICIVAASLIRQILSLS